MKRIGVLSVATMRERIDASIVGEMRERIGVLSVTTMRERIDVSAVRGDERAD